MIFISRWSLHGIVDVQISILFLALQGLLIHAGIKDEVHFGAAVEEMVSPQGPFSSCSGKLPSADECHATQLKALE